MAKDSARSRKEVQELGTLKKEVQETLQVAQKRAAEEPEAVSD